MSSLTKLLKHISPEARFRLLEISKIKLPDVMAHNQPLSKVVELQEWIKKSTTAEQQASLNYVTNRITPMTEELGYQALMSECTSMEASELRSISRQELAVKTFNTDVFQRAERIRYVNHYRGGKAWDGFSLPEMLPYDDGFDQAPLKTALQELFETKDAFYIDTFPLRDNWNSESVQWQLMIYREGVNTPFVEVNPTTDSLDNGSYKPAKEYALVYTPAQKVIEVVSSRQADRRELARLFALHALGTSVPLSELVPRGCHLEPFYTEPVLPYDDDKPIEEDILWVKVSEVVLTSPATGMENISRCSKRKLPDQHLYTGLKNNDLTELLDNGKLHFKTIVLVIAFQASRDGRHPKENITIPLTLPNKCGLKPHGIRHRYIGKFCFLAGGFSSEEPLSQSSRFYGTGSALRYGALANRRQQPGASLQTLYEGVNRVWRFTPRQTPAQH